VSPSLSQRLDVLARNLIPAALGVALVVLSTIPFYLPGYGPVAPNLVLMAVFYWAVFRSDALSPVTVFFIGLLQDILTGAPPGLNAAVLVLVRTFAASQNRVFRGKSFLVLWFGFVLVGIAAAFVIWLFSATYHLTLIDPSPVVFQAALTITLFPFLVWVFSWTHQKLMPQS